MADLSDIQAAQAIKVIGSDATGVEQTPVNSTTAGALHTNIRNSTGIEAGVTPNNELEVSDKSDNGGSHAAITVGVTAVIANVSGSTNLTNRKFLSVHNNGTVPIYWGTSNAVTTSTGTPIAKGQFVSWAVGAGTSIYLISGTASQNIRIVELA